MILKDNDYLVINHQSSIIMKKSLLIIVILVGSLNAFSQDFTPYFKMDASLGAAVAFGEFKAGGISVGTEPKVFVRPEWSVGLRYSGDIMFGGNFRDGAENVSVGLSTRATLALKSEYYFGNTTKRPFAGLALGKYTMANLTGDSNGSASITAGSSFGLSPEVGISLKNFRMSAMYNIITKKDIVNLSTGDTKEISRNYFVFHFGFKLFSVGEREALGTSR